MLSFPTVRSVLETTCLRTTHLKIVRGGSGSGAMLSCDTYYISDTEEWRIII
jgi:hypothetical protein